MPDPSGFLEHGREVPKKRPVPVRILDNREVYTRTSKAIVTAQASRCMDCGIPFCHNGCPLGNRIPEWNDLARTGRWGAAIEQLHATNNFPEFTGRLCPAPCEAACVLGIGDDPVTIKNIEVEIIDRAFDDANVRPQPAELASGKSVAVVGSGPAGLAAAQQLARAGHAVTVYERDDAPGGLLRYGIPDFKLEKHQIDRRIEQMHAEGVEFECDVNVGVDITAEDLRERHDAVILAVGALEGRETEQPGRELAGIHQAMEHLVGANQVVAGKAPFAPIDAKGKHVVIIGGGDTGADCLGVAHRQGAASVRQLDLYPTPPELRDAGKDPWPTWPVIVRNYPAHEEGGERNYASAAAEFIGDEHGHVRQMRFSEVRVDKSQGRRDIIPVEGTEQIVPADLVLLAIGFAGTEDQPLLRQFGIERSRRNVIECGDDWQTDAPGVFVAGDAHRGASLIVWAIAEGRAAAAAAHKFLGGQTALPAPVESNAQALVA
ncbi:MULTISPECIES: glutamate synthase subunit beta [Glycomyces]|uniref:Glutamate synthase (NADPH/NADH) small chain n=2 Tax=Glycomyces TaxID=58113 RepID=A0A9X3PMY5_9ACTN|nr:glutamate synthase subunit beta [Glycomyces lechevalierae]MDA1386553.1 glutamate synthase subunit beta [Glycomyces lechevalierae]MDR7340620.1 glutamate synthase (NADPH/NADH) small chain [Glycomyces lechevalierae]